MDAAYRQRVAASKAALDNELVTLARNYPISSVDDFVRLARKKLHTQVTPEYAARLLGGGR